MKCLKYYVHDSYGKYEVFVIFSTYKNAAFLNIIAEEQVPEFMNIINYRFKSF